MTQIRRLLSEIRALTEVKRTADLGQAADLAVELISAVSTQMNDATTWVALRKALGQQFGADLSDPEWKTLQTALLQAGYQKGKDAQGSKGVLPPKGTTDKDSKDLKDKVRRALADLEPEPDDPAAKGGPKAAVRDDDLRKMVTLATEIVDKAGEKGTDWDTTVREIGKRRGGRLSSPEMTKLKRELKKLGVNFEETSPGKFTVKPADVKKDPERASKGVERANQSVSDFETSMEDVLDLIQTMDPQQGKMDKDRRAKLMKLVGTLKDVVGGAAGSLQKAMKAESTELRYKPGLLLGRS